MRCGLLVILGCVSAAMAQDEGAIMAWGWNEFGQCDVPVLQADFVAVAGAGVTAWASDLTGKSLLAGTMNSASATSPCPTRTSRPWLGAAITAWA